MRRTLLVVGATALAVADFPTQTVTGAENSQWTTYNDQQFSGVIFSFELTYFTLSSVADVPYIHYAEDEDARRVRQPDDPHTPVLVQKVLARHGKTTSAKAAVANEPIAGILRRYAFSGMDWRLFLSERKTRKVAPTEALEYVRVLFRGDNDQLYAVPLELLSRESQDHPHLTERYTVWYEQLSREAALQVEVQKLRYQLLTLLKAFQQPSTRE